MTRWSGSSGSTGARSPCSRSSRSPPCAPSRCSPVDGAFMSAAYRWAFVHPLRRIHYNLTTTGLSAAAALLVGVVNLMTLLRGRVPAVARTVPWPAGVGLDGVGYLIGGLFLAAWIGSFLHWKVAGRSPGPALPDRSPEAGREGRSAASVL
ncbi:hypothetical protein AB0L10_45200 [Streptomyces flaveolus]|uniref:HoxN/HupN/NixA family nickel/cobalt transporter n=1 Tax=Streptomyces flaveolus TaxID=67297 RepID=UPI00342BB0A0